MIAHSYTCMLVSKVGQFNMLLCNKRIICLTFAKYNHSTLGLCHVASDAISIGYMQWIIT